MKPISEYFTTGTRTDGKPYTYLTDDRPQWLAEAVQEAHDDEGPNDWRYQTCYRIASAIDERGTLTENDLADWSHELADELVDFWNSDLVKWLGEGNARWADCDDAVAEIGIGNAGGVLGYIQSGQYVAIQNMATILATAYVENVETETGE